MGLKVSDAAGGRQRRVGLDAVRLLLCLEFGIWNEIVASALQGQAPIEVVGMATPDRLTAALVEGSRPEVALLSLPPSPARWAWFCQLRGILRPARVLVVGGTDLVYAAQLLRAGARGYVHGDTSLGLLVKAIVNVARGELWADHQLAATALDPELETPSAGTSLTAQEARVLEAIAHGKRNKEIATELDIAEATVKTHLNRIYRKLGVSDRLQAGLVATRYGWEPALPGR